MPFGSYEVSDEDAVRSGLRLMKEGRVDSIKLEGGMRVKTRVSALTHAGMSLVCARLTSRNPCDGAYWFNSANSECVGRI